jgi:hypothetical protein
MEALQTMMAAFLSKISEKVQPVENQSVENVKKVLSFSPSKNPPEEVELTPQASPVESDVELSDTNSPSRKKKKKKKSKKHRSKKRARSASFESQTAKRARSKSPCGSNVTERSHESHHTVPEGSRSRSRSRSQSVESGEGHTHKPDYQTTIRRVRGLLSDRLPEGSKTPVKKSAAIGGCVDKRPDRTSHYLFPAAARWDSVLPDYINQVRNVPGCNPRKRSRPFYTKEFPTVVRKKPDKYKLAEPAWTWEMPPPEPNIFQALIISKEPDIVLKGAPYKEVYNTLLQCATILSHGEWLQCAVLELLDRLLDAFREQIALPEMPAETLTEWGQMATDAKDILLAGAKDVNDAGRLALQTSAVMQLNTRDAYLSKIPYACPMTVKDSLRQAPLGGASLFSDETVTSAIDAKSKADGEEFQKRVLSDKKPGYKHQSQSQSQSQTRSEGNSSKRDRADNYRDQERSSGQSNFRWAGGRQNDGSQDRKPRYQKDNNNKGGQQRGGFKDKRGGGSGRGGRRHSYESFDDRRKN